MTEKSDTQKNIHTFILYIRNAKRNKNSNKNVHLDQGKNRSNLMLIVNDENKKKVHDCIPRLKHTNMERKRKGAPRAVVCNQLSILLWSNSDNLQGENTQITWMHPMTFSIDTHMDMIIFAKRHTNSIKNKYTKKKNHSNKNPTLSCVHQVCANKNAQNFSVCFKSVEMDER